MKNVRPIHNCFQLKNHPNWELWHLQIQIKQMISSILFMGWSKLEFESPPKETFDVLLSNNSTYYCLEDCVTGGLLPCQRLSSKGLTHLSTKPVKKKKKGKNKTIVPLFF